MFNQGQGDKNLFRKKAEISQPFIGCFMNIIMILTKLQISFT